MKKCQFCAEDIKDEAILCKHCGKKIEDFNLESGAIKPNANKHSDYLTITIVSLLLPIVGIILGIIYLSKDRKIDKKLGEHAVTVSILFIILWSLLVLILGVSDFMLYL